MSCWVVPAVAAELWGLSVQQVLESIKTGTVISKLELGFLLVDIAPNGPRIETGHRPPAAKPRTWTEVVLSEAELAALTEPPMLDSEPTPKRPAIVVEEDADSVPPPDAENADDFFEEGRLDWRKRRMEVSRTRRRPGSVAAGIRRRPATAA